MPSNYDAEKRRLIHQKSQQATTGYGKPSSDSGKEGDIAFRQIDGSGTVQYLKTGDEWVAVSSSGLMPPQRIMMGGGTSSSSSSSSTGTGLSDHGQLSGRDDDDHAQYVHTSIARTISANHAFTGTPTFTTIDINGGNIDGTTISADSTQTEWDAAYTHSQIAGGDSVHVSTTENTQWDAAYTHSLDNSQAHSDYLINNGDDTTSGTITAGGFTTSGDLDVDGVSNLDNVDIDGTVQVDNTTTTVNSTGAINLTSGAESMFRAPSLVLNGTSAVNIQEGGANVIGIDTDRYIFFHSYAQSLYNNYAFNNKAEVYHHTSGRGDFAENHSTMAFFEDTTTHETYPS